jgi:glutamate synthase (NADPH/NADH) small chain
MGIDVNRSKVKTPAAEQEPGVRSKNFDEVCLGYTSEEARMEALRCLHCPDEPCTQGCPVGVPISDFIRILAEGDPARAYATVKNVNSLPAICGRVCPQENQCEGACTRGRKGEPVAIGRLERFVADWAPEHQQEARTALEAMHHEVSPEDAAHAASKKVAVVGSGPAALTCASELAKCGVQVTVFEALHRAGGVLTYGIPEFRLPKDLVAREIAAIETAGAHFELNSFIGKLYSIEELMDERDFDAVFIGTGAGLPSYLGIEGEGLNGVSVANELLARVNLMKAYLFPRYETPVHVGEHCVVVGGGNVAMDAARTARRLGADVTVVYRRSREEMPARVEEVHHAEEEGIEFRMLANPVRAIGDDAGWIRRLECLRMELGEPDASGRRRPMPIEGSEFAMECDMLIVAAGSLSNPLIAETTDGLDTTGRGLIVADEETGATSIPGVFAGGDAVSGAATVILAMGAGKRAAKGIAGYLGL